VAAAVVSQWLGHWPGRHECLVVIAATRHNTNSLYSCSHVYYSYRCLGSLWHLGRFRFQERSKKISGSVMYSQRISLIVKSMVGCGYGGRTLYVGIILFDK
jgi:hypothetical protein